MLNRCPSQGTSEVPGYKDLVLTTVLSGIRTGAGPRLGLCPHSGSRDMARPSGPASPSGSQQRRAGQEGWILTLRAMLRILACGPCPAGACPHAYLQTSKHLPVGLSKYLLPTDQNGPLLLTPLIRPKWEADFALPDKGFQPNKMGEGGCSLETGAENSWFLPCKDIWEREVIHTGWGQGRAGLFHFCSQPPSVSLLATFSMV